MKLAVLLVSVGLLCQLIAARKSYEGYNVYRVNTKSEQDVQFLRLYEDNPEMDFWSRHKIAGKHIDIMVSPTAQEHFLKALSDKNLSYSVHVENVQESIDREAKEQAEVPYNREKISFDRYYNYEEIQTYLSDLEQQYPDLATVEVYGKSYEGRDLTAIKISSGGNGNNPTVVIDAGIHAREWAAHASALYLLQQIVENYDSNKDIVDGVDWIIVPCSNPDGYEYSQSDDRMWRKTTEPHSICSGTDGNRNYDIAWDGAGSVTNQCSDAYRGTAAFSTLESSGIDQLEKKYLDKISAYVAVHTYGQCIVYPFSYQSDTKPDDWRDLDDLANKAADAMAEIRGTRFDVGNSYDIFGLSPGCSDDYNKGVLGVKYSYTFEGYADDGFTTPPSQLSPAVEETFAGLRQVALQVKALNKMK